YGNLIFTKAPVYIDDTNVHLKTFGQHLGDLEEVFKRLRDAKLKLRLEKYYLCFREIKFLGYIIGKDGMKVDQEKIEKVKNFPILTNVTELRSFVGLASYYRRFIEGFSKIAKPLTDLFQKEKDYEWKTKQEESFEKHKRKVDNDTGIDIPRF